MKHLKTKLNIEFLTWYIEILSFTMNCTHCVQYSPTQKKSSELGTCTVDFHFCAILENGHDWLYFYEFNSKKSANLAKFSFSKNHRDIENEYFFESLHRPTFYIKEQLSKINFKIKFFLNIFVYFSKIAKRFLT